MQTDDFFDTQASVRRTNLRRALQLVFRNPGTQTRAGIAKATGLTAATASSLVAELIDSRLIVEGEQAASTGGKRATTLSVDAAHHLILVLLIQPMHTRIALVALDGTEIATSRVAYDASTRDRVLEHALAAVAVEHGERLLVAVAQLPGSTDGRRVLHSVQLGWSDLDLADRFEGVVNAPVLLVNDVDAEAIAEAAIDEDASGTRLFIHIGGGIGAAATLDGELAPRRRDRAGEIGHVQVEFGDDAPQCLCGRRGCLEAAASLTSMLGGEFNDALDDIAIAALVARVDDRTLADGARALARGIKLIAAMLDPVEVILGGPVPLLGEGFLELVRAETDYVAIGAAPVALRYADRRVSVFIGPAQFALSAVLGVRWGHEHLRAAASD